MTNNQQPENSNDDYPSGAPLSRRSALGLLGVGAGGLLVGNASANNDPKDQSSAKSHERERVTITSWVHSTVDREGNPAPFDDTDTLLYDWFQFYNPEESKLVPVTAPDRHHLTWGEFSTASGRITMKCIEKGTHVSVHVKGLIPKGLYTMWIVVFEEPGFLPDAENPVVNLIGAAPLGKNDGRQAAFRASASGRGSLVAVDEPATLTADVLDPANEDYVTGKCLLIDEYEVKVLGAYHYDDKTHGPEPRPFGVEQFGASFGSHRDECS